MGNERGRLWEVWVTLQMEIIDLTQAMNMIERQFPEEAGTVRPAMDRILVFKLEESEKVKAAMAEMGEPL